MATKRKKTNKKRKTSRKAKKKPIHRFFAATGARANAVVPFDLADLASIYWVKRIIGALLLPICWVALETLLALFRAHETAYWLSAEFVSFALGSLFWLVLFFGARSRVMMWLYVAGHEITHAIFVLICRGNVAKVHISSSGGHILTNRNNFLISLSPYFVPFYTMVVILLWAILDWQIVGFGEKYLNWLYGLIGFTWMFHLSFTIWMTRRDQPDVEQNGRLFSFSIVFLVNILIISALLIVASPMATFHSYGHSFVGNMESFHLRLMESSQELWLKLMSFLPI